MKPKARLRERETGGIVFSTEARGLIESRTSGYQTPAEIAATEETMRTALSQPHRTAFAVDMPAWVAARQNKPLGTALGRFCLCRKYRLGEHIYLAGERYGEIVREYKNAMGFDVYGWARIDGAYPTEAEMAARRDLAIRRKREVDEILLALMSRLPQAMERLCFDELEPSHYDEALIIDGLSLLAREFGTQPRNIRE